METPKHVALEFFITIFLEKGEKKELTSFFLCVNIVNNSRKYGFKGVEEDSHSFKKC